MSNTRRQALRAHSPSRDYLTLRYPILSEQSVAQAMFIYRTSEDSYVGIGSGVSVLGGFRLGLILLARAYCLPFYISR